MSKRKNESSWKQLRRQRERMRNGMDARHSDLAFCDTAEDVYYGHDVEMDDYDDVELDGLNGYEHDDEMDRYDGEDAQDVVPGQPRLS